MGQGLIHAKISATVFGQGFSHKLLCLVTLGVGIEVVSRAACTPGVQASA